MITTKEKILMTALRLFAKDGYEAVSVSTIAGELGITKGALYKHYKNKRDIFESIVQRMFEIDTERSQHYEVPKEKYEDAPMNYEKVLIENIKNFTAAQFRFWTEDDFASNFRKMLTLEQYRNTEMAELYSDCITLGPVTYMEDIFREMILKGMLKKADPKQLAIEFYAPMYLLINISDTSTDKEKLLDLLNVHIQKFIQNNIMEG
ncbi:MAG: TetR/AcrR family transcriptional regulator [Eubacterium sp.]|jgi:AcrR family transcriptional regulator|nr:TetR/AcrR family transcriptional regulator [Eubacterium sp.]